MKKINKFDLGDVVYTRSPGGSRVVKGIVSEMLMRTYMRHSLIKTNDDYSYSTVYWINCEGDLWFKYEDEIFATQEEVPVYEDDCKEMRVQDVGQMLEVA